MTSHFTRCLWAFRWANLTLFTPLIGELRLTLKLYGAWLGRHTIYLLERMKNKKYSLFFSAHVLLYRTLIAFYFAIMGAPVHRRGVTNEEGVYFIGLPWLYTWGSGRFSGVAADAVYLSKVIRQAIEEQTTTESLSEAS